MKENANHAQEIHKRWNIVLVDTILLSHLSEDKEELALTQFHCALMNVRSIFHVENTNVKRSVTLIVVKPVPKWLSKNVNAEKIKERFNVSPLTTHWKWKKKEWQMKSLKEHLNLIAQKFAIRWNHARDTNAKLFVVMWKKEQVIQMVTIFVCKNAIRH